MRLAPRSDHLEAALVTPPVAALDDAGLVAAIAEMRQEALAEAYRRHAEVARSAARAVLRDPAFAEDVVQDVFWRLWSRPERFDAARGTLRGWMLGQAHGRSVDVLRSEVARHQREEREAKDATADAAYEIEPAVVEAALASRVHAAVASLPEAERRAVELAYYGGHSYRQVAALLAEPEGTVKGRIRVGLRRLQAWLAADGTAAAWRHP